MNDALIETWRAIIVGDAKSWVLFEHGTCAILTEPEPDLAEQAVRLMREWGSVHPGSPAGDFSVIPLDDHPGWVATGHHPDILTYVSPDEVDEGAGELRVGLYGRSKRGRDAEDLCVIHVEDSR